MKQKTKKNSYVYYFHNKGACCPNGPIADWRDSMNAWILEFPSICLRALSRGYSTCGIDYNNRHYSGNFWWANCKHIAELPKLLDNFDHKEPEFFLFKTTPDPKLNDKYSKHCGYNPFHCGVDSYNEECPRAKYLPALLENIEEDKLPINPTAIINTSMAFVKEKCSAIQSLPYTLRSNYIKELS